jgi:hypothetical protein
MRRGEERSQVVGEEREHVRDGDADEASRSRLVRRRGERSGGRKNDERVERNLAHLARTRDELRRDRGGKGH